MRSAVDIDDLQVRYRSGTPIIDGLDLRVERGSFVAIIGPNACGKSTLLRAIARVLEPTAGTILLDGRDIRDRRPKDYARELGMLAQSSNPPEGMRVAELVARGRYPHRRAFTAWTAADEDAVTWAMDATGVRDLATHDVDALSGGQRQRVWLAMALAQDTRTLLLDEPTTYLDIAHQFEMLDLFRTVNRSHERTIVAVLHDLNHAARYADHLIAMRGGRIIAQGPPAEVLTEERVHDVFGLACRVIDDPETGTPLVIARAQP